MFKSEDIAVFIFSWKRVSQQTPGLFRAVKTAFTDTTFINCDEHMTVPEDIQPCIQLDDRYYYGGQFQNAIRNCPPGKIMCCIVGDVKEDGPWTAIRDNCVAAFNTGKVGIYAPNVDFTDHPGKGEKFMGDLFHVSNTDCTCWFIHPDIIRVLRPVEYMALSNIGWGIDVIAIRESHKRRLSIVRDYSVLIIQPKGRGYSNDLGSHGYRQLLHHYVTQIQPKDTT
jgi:hypothetical protein